MLDVDTRNHEQGDDNRAFEDPDGHVFEAVWMDMKAAAATGEEA